MAVVTLNLTHKEINAVLDFVESVATAPRGTATGSLARRWPVNLIRLPTTCRPKAAGRPDTVSSVTDRRDRDVDHTLFKKWIGGYTYKRWSV